MLQVCRFSIPFFFFGFLRWLERFELSETKRLVAGENSLTLSENVHQFLQLIDQKDWQRVFSLWGISEPKARVLKRYLLENVQTFFVTPKLTKVLSVSGLFITKSVTGTS